MIDRSTFCILSILFLCFLIHGLNSDLTNKENTFKDDVDHLIDDEIITNKNLKDGPVKFEIVGDTSHLFADEDFEKKQVVILHQNETAILEEEYGKVNQLKNESLNNTGSKNKGNLHQLDCLNKNLTRENNTVQLVNGSRLTYLLSEAETNECYLVLFYVPWCPFSTRLAPIYNALPRVFTNLNVLAFDVSRSIGYNTKFGTSAVPMILLFQNKNVLAKFNYTHKNLSDYVDFLRIKTGIEANNSVTIDEQDLVGPVPAVPVEKFDYYLFISWVFLIAVSIDFLIRKTNIKSYLLKFAKRLICYLIPTKLLELPQPPEIPMIQDNNPHLHND